MSSDSRLKFTLRPGPERGHSDQGWLQTYHTFAFDKHQDSKHIEWGALRVLNEDFIQRGRGFGEHEHEEFEIWTYMIKGEITHKDSLGHVEVLRAGDVQYTSAGTGIRHSESNENKRKNVHLLQIWAKPGQAALKPVYYTRHFPPSQKKDVFCSLLIPSRSVSDISAVPAQDTTSSEPIPCFAELSMSAVHLSASSTVTGEVKGKKAYLHFAMRSGGYLAPDASKRHGRLIARCDKGDLVLHEGDGLYISGPGKVCSLVLTNEGESMAEVVLIDS